MQHTHTYNWSKITEIVLLCVLLSNPFIQSLRLKSGCDHWLSLWRSPEDYGWWNFKYKPLNNFWFIFLFKLPNLIMWSNGLIFKLSSRSISFYSLSIAFPNVSSCITVRLITPSVCRPFSFFGCISPGMVSPLFSVFLSCNFSFFQDLLTWQYTMRISLFLPLACWIAEIEDTVSLTSWSELVLRTQIWLNKGWIYLSGQQVKRTCHGRKETLLMDTWQPG